jgi:hypothetical protein
MTGEMTSVPCPCGRMEMSSLTWLCRLCYMEKELNYAIGELERGTEMWREAALSRLRKIAGMT